ncbi:MAG TPA: hypothetical protein VM617_04080, partial [Thermoanaerobaculia bacterium]|nr:hypothetical protein [Thermoanaerobaculia bacterium]
MSASAYDSIVRGFASLRANWQLVPLLWLQQMLVLVLLVLGAAVPSAVVGVEGWRRFAAWRPGRGDEALLELAAIVAPLALPLAIALLGTAVVWTLAVIVFCWFQGGSFAVLLAAERQAPPGPPGDWRLFRTYERGFFTGWARRLTWRYFGFWNLWGLAALGWGLALALLVVAAQAAALEWGVGGLVTVAVAGSLALGVGFFVLAGWGLVAPPHLAAETGGVGRSSRIALALLGRRPAAVAVVVGVFLGLWLLVAFAVGSVGTPLLLLDVRRDLALWLGGQLLVWLLQVAATVAVATAMNGALAALVVG